MPATDLKSPKKGVCQYCEEEQDAAAEKAARVLG